MAPGSAWRVLWLLCVPLAVALAPSEPAAQISVRAEGTFEVDFAFGPDQVVADLQALGVEVGATGTVEFEYDLTTPATAGSLFFNALTDLQIRVGDFSVDGPAAPPCDIFGVQNTCSSFNVNGTRVDVQAQPVFSPDLDAVPPIVFIDLTKETPLEAEGSQPLGVLANGDDFPDEELPLGILLEYTFQFGPQAGGWLVGATGKVDFLGVGNSWQTPWSGTGGIPWTRFPGTSAPRSPRIATWAGPCSSNSRASMTRV